MQLTNAPLRHPQTDISYNSRNKRMVLNICTNAHILATRVLWLVMVSPRDAAMTCRAAHGRECGGQHRYGGSPGCLPDEAESRLGGEGELPVSHDRELRVVLVTPVRPCRRRPSQVTERWRTTRARRFPVTSSPGQEGS